MTSDLRNGAQSLTLGISTPVKPEKFWKQFAQTDFANSKVTKHLPVSANIETKTAHLL